MDIERTRVGIVGAGANTRLRHIPGLKAIPGVEIVSVASRRPACRRRSSPLKSMAARTLASSPPLNPQSV